MKFCMAFYKGTRPGIAGIYNRAVRAKERGPYSHCELVFSDGWSASASFADKGVRFKLIDYDPAHWDFIELPAAWEPAAIRYFKAHKGERYDLVGNVYQLFGFIPDARGKKFCSEACGGAIGIADPWRFGPNALYSAVKRLAEGAELRAVA